MLFHKKTSEKIKEIFEELFLEKEKRFKDSSAFLSPLLGSQSGLYVTPSPQDEVVLLAPNGELDNLALLKIVPQKMPKKLFDGGICIYFGESLVKFFSKENRIEIWQKDQKLFTFDNSSLTIEKDLVVKGKISAEGEIESTSAVKAGGISLGSHTHQVVVTCAAPGTSTTLVSGAAQ